jgi:hypothetical protein
MTTFLTISIVGGPQFLLFIVITGLLYWNGEWFPVRTITDVLKFSLQSFEGGSQQHTSMQGRNIKYFSKQIYGQTSRDLRRLGMSTDFVHPVHWLWSNSLRFGHAVTLVLNIWRNDFRSHDHPCLWCILEIPT